ncbi:aldehyde dehydrogenase family-domain-containing protein [Xylaria flabelliformis]|nr:aldehyde dehydrogenase family-domain-containing protein [Xylaria flabelliformis]
MASDFLNQNDTNVRSSIYTPLDYTQPQVRFIEIIPFATDDEPVSCRLKIMDLTKNIPYAALSYVWGDINFTEDILVNGIKLPVTTNLASALRQFRTTGFPHHPDVGKLQWLWVDAICINQNNIEEKNHQVPFMGKIYSNASLVLSWLGIPDYSRLDAAIHTIHNIAPIIRATPDGSGLKAGNEVVHTGFRWLISTLGPDIYRASDSESTATGWQALKALGSHVYWKRAWIVQEIVLARSPSIHWFICGSESATFAELLLFSSFITSLKNTSSPPLSEYGPRSMERGTWYHLSNTPVYLLPSLYVIEVLKKNIQDQPGDDYCSIFKAAALMALFCSATLPQDLIYAALGMVQQPNILPDYRKSVKEVYLDAAKVSVGTQLSIFLQSSGYGIHTDNEYDLPSWLPDLTKLPLPQETLFARPDPNKRFLLDDQTVPQPPVVAGSVLRVKGAFCAQVKLLKNISSYLDGDIKKGLYHLCVDYIVEFYGLLETLISIAVGGVSVKRPLEKLLDVLDWEEKDSRSVVPSFLGLSNGLRLSSVGWNFFTVLLLSDKLTPDEKKDMCTRLELPHDMDLSVFLMSCFVNYESLSLDQVKGQNWAYDGSGEEYQHFLEILRNRSLFKTDTGNLGLGPPNMKEGDLNQPQYERVKELLIDIKNAKLIVATGSTEPLKERKGYFLAPTIIDNPPDDSRIVVGEQFGPILPLMKWSEELDVIRRANATESGLGASVWSRDKSQADRIAQQLQAGNVWINCHAEMQPSTPFTGHKQSGMGIEMGMEGLKSYCSVQSVYTRPA